MKKMAVLGPKGTYSDLEAKNFIASQSEEIEIEYFNSFYRVFDNFKDYAIVPIENSLAGHVIENLDMLMDSDYKIIHQDKLKVNFLLVGDNNLKRVYVQHKAYEECREFLLKHDYEIIRCNSNTEALRLYIGDQKESGVIVPKHLYNEEYNIISKDVEDAKNNETRFFVLAKDIIIPESDELAFSLVIISKTDRSGILYDILSEFKALDINLTGIISRPLKTKMGEYKFYIECAITKGELANIDVLISSLNKEFFVKLLGIYNKI